MKIRENLMIILLAAWVALLLYLTLGFGIPKAHSCEPYWVEPKCNPLAEVRCWVEYQKRTKPCPMCQGRGYTGN